MLADNNVPREKSLELIDKVTELKGQLVEHFGPVITTTSLETQVLRSLDKIDDIKFQMV